MNKRFAAFFILGLAAAQLNAQQAKDTYGITLSGFVKTDIIADSRQTVTAREGHFLLYPAPEFMDINNTDVNAKPNFNILSVQSRVTGNISAPEAFGAKTSGQIEGEFFGTADGDANGFRLRHAYLKLDWQNTALLVGQTWHPMFVTEMFPAVVSFNTGVPFQPFGRGPQIRFTQTLDNLKLIAAAISQRDFPSNGPSGFSSVYLRNSFMPNLHLQVQYAETDYFGGMGVDFKQLTPRLISAKGVKSDERVSALSLMAFLKVRVQSVTVKAQGILGQNLADLMHIGGYAVKSTDAATGIETYTPLKTTTVWGEISTGKEIEYALFAGFTKAMGADSKVTGPYYGRGTDIESVLRLSPRVQFTSGKTKISTELEMTSAKYGTPNGLNNGKAENAKKITNLRLLIAFFYFF